MFSRGKGLYRILIFITVWLILGFTPLDSKNLTGLISSNFYSCAYADPEISQQSIDILTRTGQAIAEIVETVKPAIVNISSTRIIKVPSRPPFFDDPFLRRFFGDEFGFGLPKERKAISLGSGVIVDPKGYILTSYHVIQGAEEIKVTLLDKREFKGTVVGTDAMTDIAVIKIEAGRLQTIKWGDSGRLRVGETVLAIGSPYGLTGTVTMGIVSAVGRANVGIAEYEDFIQTDAAINPGNSGGALVNVRGELVGINSAIYTITGGYQGIGFAIPSNMAKAVMESLIKKGKVIRGWLGVTIQSLTPELAKQFNLKEERGVLVADVIEESPAEKAGIMRGDVIIEYKGKKFDEPYQLRNMVANTAPGEEVELEIIRENRTEMKRVTIGELPAEMQRPLKGKYNNLLRGITVQNLTPEIYERLNLPERLKGVVISDIDEDSPAAMVLMRGDVIQEINRQKITSVADYENVVSKIKQEEDILLLVFRGGSSFYITLSGK
ncbi:MAG: DegQ family serine endoprotease [Thermodesulfovibrionales bacterium]|nr:DegQ family serine endoprotease [Thermodesulfovibrionales bacterium]